MLNIDPMGVLWTVVNLLVLYLLLKKFLFKPVTAMMESRTREIEDNLSDAETQKKAAEAARREVDGKLAQADQAAAEILAQARNRGRREYQTILDAAHADARRVAGEARTQLAAEREAMLRGARQEVAALALLAASRVAGQAMDAKADGALVDAFLTEAGDFK